METSRNAFTLIALLIVVAIIAILAAIALTSFPEAQAEGKACRPAIGASMERWVWA